MKTGSEGTAAVPDAQLDVRPATAADRDDMVAIILASHRSLHGPAPSGADYAENVADAVLAPHSGATMLIGWLKGTPVAYAALAVHHPGPTPAGDLFLKFLFVAEGARGGGVGTLMLRAVARHALALGCSRLDWTAGTDNERALALYDRLGAPRGERTVYYRLGGERLSAFAEGRTGPAARDGL